MEVFEFSLLEVRREDELYNDHLEFSLILVNKNLASLLLMKSEETETETEEEEEEEKDKVTLDRIDFTNAVNVESNKVIKDYHVFTNKNERKLIEKANYFCELSLIETNHEDDSMISLQDEKETTNKKTFRFELNFLSDTNDEAMLKERSVWYLLSEWELRLEFHSIEETSKRVKFSSSNKRKTENEAGRRRLMSQLSNKRLSVRRLSMDARKSELQQIQIKPEMSGYYLSHLTFDVRIQIPTLASSVDTEKKIFYKNVKN